MTSSLDMIRGRSNIVTLTNNSGGALVAGDVCVQDTSADEKVTTTTSAASVLKIFVAAESIGIGAAGKFYSSGYCPLVTPSASVTRGRYLFTHTVAKQAAESATYGAGAFGVILKSGITPVVWLFGSTAQTSASIGGSSGSTDNAIIRADGTGGATIQSSLATVDDSGGVNIPTGQTYNINGSPHTHAAAASGLLAVKVYAPASIQIYSITGTSMADVDTTNLAVTFTAPASGNVLVRLGAFCDETVNGEAYWGLRESTTDVAGSIGRIIRLTTDQGYISYTIYVSGIGAGSHTYKWSAAVQSGATHRIIIQDGSGVTKWAPGIMEVWAAP